MSIHLKHPTYIDFVRNEQKTLNFLFNSTQVNTHFPKLSGNASAFFYRYKGLTDTALKKSQFEFSCNFDILVEKVSRRVVVESIVTPDFSMVSYMLGICETDADPLSMIRKFHFDYAIPNKDSSKWPKPVYHLQYGGEQSKGLEALKIDISGLHPKISSPRISYGPINLAILFDMIFFEFRTEETIGIVERSEWRDLMKNNEDIILKPFYEVMDKFIKTDHKSSFLIRDFNYGISD